MASGRTRAFRQINYRLTPRRGSRPAAIPLRLTDGLPRVTADTVVTHLDEKGHVWRIVNLAGPEDQLAKVEQAFEAYRPAFLIEHRVLGRTRGRRVLWYKYGAALDKERRSLTALAFETLGRETVITDRTERGQLTVKVLCLQSPRIRRFLDRLAKAAEPEYELELLYVGPPSAPAAQQVTAGDEETLRAAWDAGYWAVPRRAGLDEVARSLDVSVSSAGYRLRRAMSKLVRSYLGVA